MVKEVTLLLSEGYLVICSFLSRKRPTVKATAAVTGFRGQMDIIIPVRTEGLRLQAFGGPKRPARIFLMPDTPVYIKSRLRTQNRKKWLLP